MTDRVTRRVRRGWFLWLCVVGATVLLAGCQWAMYGAGPGRTGWNPAERTVSLGNVGQLQPGWSAPAYGAFVVANGLVYASVQRGTTPAAVQVFSARGASGCSGTPNVCSPLWSAGTRGGIGVGSPVVQGRSLYFTNDGTLYAYDARGVTNCGGSPRVCQPLWSAPGNGNRILVDRGRVFVLVLDGDNWDLAAYDAAGAVGCGGSPKVCQPLWQGVNPGCNEVEVCDAVGDLMATGGRVYLQFTPFSEEADGPPEQVWFDETGSAGCSGTPVVCTGSVGSGGKAAGLGGAHGLIVSTYQVFNPDPLSNPSRAILDVTDSSAHLLWTQLVEERPPGEREKTAIGKPAVVGPTAYLPVGTGIQAWAVDQPSSCTSTLSSTCVAQWRTTSVASTVTVANGVLYDDLGRAYDAAGKSGCTGSPKICAPIAQIGPATANVAGTETEIVNGWVYRLLASGLQAYHLS